MRQMSRAARQEILLSGGSLAEGQTDKIVCPYCGGGTGGETSLAISRVDGGILWKCHRASCGIYGRAGGSWGSVRAPEGPHKGKPYGGSRVPLPDYAEEFLRQRKGQTPESLHRQGVFWSPERESVMMPLRDHRGYDTGIEGRRYKELTGPFRGPKSITFYDVTPPVAEFPLGWDAEASSMVLVEDCLSAYRAVSAGIPTVALRGVHIKPELAKVLFEDIGIRKLILALDNDAFRESIRLCRNWSHMFETVPFYLSRDLKDMTDGMFDQVSKRLGELL